MANPYVNVSEDKVDTENTSTGAVFSSMWDYADKYSTQLDNAIDTINEVVGTFDPNYTIPDIISTDIDGPSFPEKPAFPPLSLDDGWPETFPFPDELEPYGSLDFTYVSPVAPAEIDGNFSWTDEDYSSVMWSSLFNKVHNDILNGGNGLTSAVYSAIVARERETRRTNQDREYRRGLNAVGASGFNLASGQIASFERTVTTEMISKDQDALNNIIVKDFDIAVENTRFAITTGTDLERMLRATFETAQQRGLEAAKATKEYLIAVYEANVRKYLADWEGVKLDLEALKMKVDAISSKNESIQKIFIGRADVYETQIRAISAKNDSIIGARQGEIDTYKSEVDAVSVEYNALIEETRLKLDANKTEVLAAIEEAKVDIQAYTSKTSLARDVSGDIANISAQALASALGGIRASIGNTFTASRQISEAWRHAETIREAHDFQEE